MLHLYLWTESRQAACDVRPRLVTVTLSLPLVVNDQDFYSFCASKQGQGIRYRPNGLARGAPGYEDATDPRRPVGWWENNDWSAGTQD
jgi:hypothetical protein